MDTETNVKSVPESETKVQSQFINRVLTIPVVSSATGQVTDVYTTAKSSHSAIKYTMETAASVVNYGVQAVQPLLEKLEKPIIAVDNFACDQLNAIESTFPIITKQPQEILDASKNTYEGVKNYGTSKVTDIKSFGYDTVQSVKNYGSEKLSAIMETEVGKHVVQEVEKIVALTEKYFDILIPPVENEKDIELAAVASQNTVERLAVLSDKAHRRIRSLALQQLEKLRTRGQEKIDELKAILTLMKDRSVASAQKYNERVQCLWQEVNKSDDQEVGNNWQDQLLQKARLVTKTLTQIFKQVSNTIAYVSESTKQKFIEAKDGAENMYQTFVKVSNIEEISEHACTVFQEQVSKLNELLKSLGLLTKSPQLTESASSPEVGSSAKTQEIN